MKLQTIRVEKVGKREWKLIHAFPTAWHTVPAGFVSNGASVPRPLWWLISPATDFFEAAVVHDHLLLLRRLGHGVTLTQANTAFWDVAKAYRTNPVVRTLAYAAVSLYTHTKDLFNR